MNARGGKSRWAWRTTVQWCLANPGKTAAIFRRMEERITMVYLQAGQILELSYVGPEWSGEWRVNVVCTDPKHGTIARLSPLTADGAIDVARDDARDHWLHLARIVEGLDGGRHVGDDAQEPIATLPDGLTEPPRTDDDATVGGVAGVVPQAITVDEEA